MGLIDPRTGKTLPKTKEKKVLDDVEIMQILTVHAHKIDLLNNMHLQLALWTEYVVEKVMSIQGPDGNPLLTFDVKEFQEFAQRRYTQMQQEQQEQDQSAQRQQAEELLQDVQTAFTDVDLDG
jgi:hypothetical protein